jgi:hypothetical protein
VIVTVHYRQPAKPASEIFHDVTDMKDDSPAVLMLRMRGGYGRTSTVRVPWDRIERVETE